METENETIINEQPETPTQNDISTEEETARYLAEIEATNKPIQPPIETVKEPEPEPKPKPAKAEVKPDDKTGFSFDLLTIAILGLAIALVYLIYIKINNDD